MTQPEGKNNLQENPYFLLSGAFLSYNLGTAAMAFSAMDLLNKNFPGCHICVLSTRSDRDSFLYPNQHVQHDSRTSFQGALIFCRAVLWWLAKKLIRRDLKWLRADDELNVYYQSSLLVDLSGDTITEDYGPLVLFSHCIPILIAKCFGSPVVLFGQTIGPFSWSTALMRRMLQHCDVIIARDNPTYQYLQKIGIPEQSLKSSIDTGFLLEPASVSKAKVLEAECNYDPKDRLTLGMSVSRQFQEFVEEHPDRRDKPGLNSTLSEVIDTFVETYDAQVVLFAHVTGPPERLDDRVVSRELRNSCRRSDRVVVVDKELSASEIKALISRCDLFCGSRMHSNIAATTTGVPTIAMAYSVKSRGIMGRMSMEDWVVEIPQLTTDHLLECLNSLRKHSKDVHKE